MSEGCRGKHDKNLATVFVDHVVYYQRGNDPDPELGCVDAQIAQWLAELRVDLQAVVDLANGCENLGREVDSPCPGDESLQSVADAARIRHEVGVHRYPRASCSSSP